MDNHFDYIIIGSGFGGSVSAMRLAEKGYSVLVLEKGKRFAAGDFPRSNWQLRKFLWAPAIRCYGIQKIDFFSQAMVLSGTGVGGGSLVYANTHMMPPDSFYRNPVWARYRDWKQTLAPFYEKAKFMLGTTRYEKVNAEDLVLEEVAREWDRAHTCKPVDGVGVYFGPVEEAKDPYFRGLGPERKGCRECAGCMVGCRYNAKNTLDKNYLWFAERFGARIQAETIADKIEYTGEGYRVHTYRLGKRSERQVFYSKGLVVSAGVLGTLKLLLRQKYDLKTLAGLSDRLGENLLTNSESLCGVIAADRKLNHGLAINRVFEPDEQTHIELCKYPDGSTLMTLLGTLAAGPGPVWLRVLKWFGRVLTHPGQVLRARFSRNKAARSLFLLVMQSADNRMRMRWKRGILGKRLKMENPGKRVPAYIDVGQKVMEDYARKVNGVPMNATSEIFLNLSSTAHILGGCPMGPDKESGVVDDRFRVHGYPAMYIIDGSIIPCNLGVNPSLTITALAEYAMDQVPRKPGSIQKTLEEQMAERA